jgi:hypothetical protein
MRSDGMELKEFIKPELLILIPVLYVVGIGLKKSKLSDTLIPLVLGGIAIVLSAAWVIATSDISTLKDVAYALFVSVTQGILSAGASVYVNQLYVQSKKKD